jgi:hypothetical protein
LEKRAKLLTESMNLLTACADTYPREWKQVPVDTALRWTQFRGDSFCSGVDF